MVSDAVLSRWLSRPAVALWGDVIRASLWGAVALTWTVFGQIYARLWHQSLTSPGNSDFTIFYFTARLVRDGLPMYGGTPARYGVDWSEAHLGNLNPPHFQLLLQPLAFLSYEHAFVAWTLANLAALAGSLVVIQRTVGEPMTLKRGLIVGALIIAAAPFTSVVATAELSFLVMLPFTLVWSAAVRERWTAAGVWLGICASLKLFFLLFVPWLLLARRWRALGAAVLAASGCFGLGLAVYGLETYQLWKGTLSSVGWWWLPMNASWHGFVSRVFVGSETLRPVVEATAMMRPVAAAGGVTVCLLSLWAARRCDAHGNRHAAVLLLLAGAMLASPLGWVYYLPLGLGPLCGLVALRAWRRVSRGWQVAAIAAGGLLYVPMEQAAAGQPSALATVTLASSYFWAVVLSWALLVWMAVPSTPEGTAWASRGHGG